MDRQLFRKFCLLTRVAVMRYTYTSVLLATWCYTSICTFAMKSFLIERPSFKLFTVVQSINFQNCSQSNDLFVSAIIVYCKCSLIERFKLSSQICLHNFLSRNFINPYFSVLHPIFTLHHDCQHFSTLLIIHFENFWMQSLLSILNYSILI